VSDSRLLHLTTGFSHGRMFRNFHLCHSVENDSCPYFWLLYNYMFNDCNTISTVYGQNSALINAIVQKQYTGKRDVIARDLSFHGGVKL